VPDPVVFILRTFLVHVPQRYENVSTPLFFMFHGYTDSAERFIRATDLAQVRARA